MLNLLKRITTHGETETQPSESQTLDREVHNQARQAQEDEAFKRDVQLFLHSYHLFPSKISVNEGDWAEVAFYPSNTQRQEAAGILRGLHRDGRITVKGQLQPIALNGWSAQLRLNT